MIIRSLTLRNPIEQYMSLLNQPPQQQQQQQQQHQQMKKEAFITAASLTIESLTHYPSLKDTSLPHSQAPSTASSPALIGALTGGPSMNQVASAAGLGLYPTPSTSPTGSCPASPPRLAHPSADLHGDSTSEDFKKPLVPTVMHHDQQSVATPAGLGILIPSSSTAQAIVEPVQKKRKRKSSEPKKAPLPTPDQSPLQLETQGIIQLNVFSLYLMNPQSLTGVRPLKSRRLGFGGHQGNSSCSSSTSFVSAGSNFVQQPSVLPATSITAVPLPESGIMQDGLIYIPSQATISIIVNYENQENRVPTNSNHERKLMMAPIPEQFDMSPYQQTLGAPVVLWKKGGSLTIPRESPNYDVLTPEEIRTCSSLRILPDQYLHLKAVILHAAETKGPFKKRDAKSWFRIDVNKTAVLYDWFRSLGWLPSDLDWERRFREQKVGP